MDTGYLEPGEELEDSYDLGRDLQPEEVIWIMDELIRYQCAWHQGYSLSQNILTSLYIDNLLSHIGEPGIVPEFHSDAGREPNELTRVVLRTFCAGVIKSCDICIELIQSQHYYEEEDFNTQTFTKNLLIDFPDESFWQLVLESKQWLTHQYENKRLEWKQYKALLARLLLNSRLLEVVFPSPQDSPLGQTPFDDSFDQILDCIKETHGLGVPVVDAFSSKMQRRLASTVPPRPVATVPFDDACSQLRKMREDLDEAVLVDNLDLPMSVQDLEVRKTQFHSPFN